MKASCLSRAILAIMAISALLIGPAFAQNSAQQCGPMQAITAWLADNYDESPRGMGVAANGKLMQLFASPPPESTWTITVTTASGVMCMVASGNNYEEAANPALAPQGDPA